MTSDNVIRFEFSTQVEATYFNLVNNSGWARDYYARVVGGTSSSMKNVSRKQIQACRVPLPPRAEQVRIVEAVEQCWNICDALQKSIAFSARTQAEVAACAARSSVLH